MSEGQSVGLSAWDFRGASEYAAFKNIFRELDLERSTIFWTIAENEK